MMNDQQIFSLEQLSVLWCHLQKQDLEETQDFCRVREQNKKKDILEYYVGATCWISKFRCLVGSWIFTIGI